MVRDTVRDMVRGSRTPPITSNKSLRSRNDNHSSQSRLPSGACHDSQSMPTSQSGMQSQSIPSRNHSPPGQFSIVIILP